MRLSPKPILRAIGSFIRKNDTKILKIAAYGVTAAGAAIAVKGGMDAAIEIKEKEAKLKEETQNPEATLPAKEKAKTVIKKVLPGGAVMIGGTVLNEVAFYILNKRVIVATAVGEYTAVKSILNSSAEKEKTESNNKELPEIIPSDIKESLRHLDDVTFDVFVPIVSQTIHGVTVKKIVLTELFMNYLLKDKTYIYLDWILEALGGHSLPPWLEYRYAWRQNLIDFEFNPLHSISFIPEIDGNRIVLRFSEDPEKLEDVLLDKFVS